MTSTIGSMLASSFDYEKNTVSMQRMQLLLEANV